MAPVIRSLGDYEVTLLCNRSKVRNGNTWSVPKYLIDDTTQRPLINCTGVFLTLVFLDKQWHSGTVQLTTQEQFGWQIVKAIDSEEKPQKKSGLATRFVKNQWYRIHNSYTPEGEPEREEHEIPNRNDQTVTNTALNKQTSNSICHCRKICKNIRGLKIHQARTRCQVEITEIQRAVVSLGETQEAQGRKAHHSAQSLQAEVIETDTAFRKIKWPTATNKNAWQDFDTNIGEIINISAKKSGENRHLKGIIQLTTRSASCK